MFFCSLRECDCTVDEEPVLNLPGCSDSEYSVRLCCLVAVNPGPVNSKSSGPNSSWSAPVPTNPNPNGALSPVLTNSVNWPAAAPSISRSSPVGELELDLTRSGTLGRLGDLPSKRVEVRCHGKVIELVVRDAGCPSETLAVDLVGVLDRRSHLRVSTLVLVDPELDLTCNGALGGLRRSSPSPNRNPFVVTARPSSASSWDATLTVNAPNSSAIKSVCWTAAAPSISTSSRKKTSPASTSPAAAPTNVSSI